MKLFRSIIPLLGLAAAGVAAPRPNVLFIVADDLCNHLGIYDHDADPGEHCNLAVDSRQTGTIAELRQFLRTGMK